MRGIDVSSHQGKIDWKTVKSSGIDFAIIRAGYGNSTVDKCFEYNITEALKVGLKVGVYWFCYALNEKEAREEADFCIATVKKYKLSFPIFYDLEYDTERYAKEHKVTFTLVQRCSIIASFCSRVNELGYKAGIYTNLDYINYRLNLDYLREYPVWLATYNDDEEQSPLGEMLKQTTDSGKVAGIKGYVDMNVCYITFTDNEPAEWSKEAVEWAVKNKILQGDENGDYKLREPCTTERFITLLYRALNR